TSARSPTPSARSPRRRARALPRTTSEGILSVSTRSSVPPLDHAERVRLLVPGRQHSPRERDRDDQRNGASPPEGRGQEDRGAELLEEPGLRRDQPRERRAQGEAGDRGPELHLPLAGAPERARPAAAGERHPHAEGEAAG